MSKEARKTVCFVLVLISTFIVVDLLFGKIALKMLLNMPAAPNELGRRNYVVSASDDDCLILGSSRAAHHYNSLILQDSLNVSVYNAGLDGHGISYANGILKARVQRSKPSLVILECSSIELLREWLNSVSSLKPYYELYPKVLEVAQTVNGKKEKLKSKFAFYRFNSSLFPMIKTYLSMEKDHNKGFVPLSNEDSKIILDDIHKESSITQIDSVCNNVLVDFISTCKNENIQLVVCYSPILGDVKSEAMILSKLFEDQDILFFDYSGDTTFINHPQQLFRDNTHLNKRGADIYSQLIAHKIKALL